MDSQDQSNEDKTGSRMDAVAFEIDIPFKVFWHETSVSEGRALKLAKPSQPDWDKSLVLNKDKDCPNVSLKMASAGNQHALYIMHNLNHINIMSVRALGRSKSQKGDELSLFIEECNGNLYDSLLWNVFADQFGHIPSPTFQLVIREIIDGVDFLWRNGTYHGNLSWVTTHYKHPFRVKLYDFKEKDISLEEAQWEDWDDIIAMVQFALDKADKQTGPKLVSDEIKALIDMMKASERINPLRMREIIFEEVFFWTSSRRTKFFIVTIAKLLHNEKFIKKVEKSNICLLPWHCADKKKAPNTRFDDLVEQCNYFCEHMQPLEPYFDNNSRMGFVSFIVAAYKHRSQIQDILKVGVDYIIRPKFPKLFLELNCIVRRLQIKGLVYPEIIMPI